MVETNWMDSQALNSSTLADLLTSFVDIYGSSVAVCQLKHLHTFPSHPLHKYKPPYQQVCIEGHSISSVYPTKQRTLTWI